MSFEYGLRFEPALEATDTTAVLKALEALPQVSRVYQDEFGHQIVFAPDLSMGGSHGDAQLNLHEGGLILAMHTWSRGALAALIEDFQRALVDAGFRVTLYEV